MKDNIALITGASRGIGAETARELSRAGAHVVLTARDEKALRRVASTLVGPVTVVPADLLDEASVDHLVKETVREVGVPDVLVNVAGVWHNKRERYQGPSFSKTPMHRVEEVIGVGIIGGMRVTHGFLPAMVKRRRGHVINVGCGFAGPHEAVGWLHYYVANQAIAAMTAGLAAELRSSRIQVNCVAPWFVATEYVQRFYRKAAARALSPRRVAETIRALVAGPLSSDVNGQVIELRSDEDI